MKEADRGRGGGPDAEVPLLVSYRDGLLHHSGSTSFFKTCFNGVNALSGVGILSIPYAVSSGGWLSLVLFFLIASSTYYTAMFIQRCMDMDHTIRTYPDIGERAFGAPGRAVVSIAMLVELYLVAVGFLILEGDNLHDLFPNVDFGIGGKNGFILIVGLIVMLPTIWSDNLSILSWFSAGGVVASLVLICAIFWGGAVEGIGFQEEGILLNPKGIPTAVSLYAFCYCAHPVFPTLYTSMRNKKQFSEVMVITFVVCTAGYASVAIMGYLMFGSNVESQVTLNLPMNHFSSKLAIITTCINPLAKYSLMVTPIVNALESSSFLCCSERKGFRVAIRMGLVASTVVVALTIPFFEYLMSLVGALLSITASVIVPSLCYLKMTGLYRRFGVTSGAIYGIVVGGCVVLVVGTYVALLEIYHQLMTT